MLVKGHTRNCRYGCFHNKNCCLLTLAFLSLRCTNPYRQYSSLALHESLSNASGSDLDRLPDMPQEVGQLFRQPMLDESLATLQVQVKCEFKAEMEQILEKLSKMTAADKFLEEVTAARHSRWQTL